MREGRALRLSPVVVLVCCFGAGLATGLSRFPGPALVVAGLALAVVLRRHDHVLYPLTLLLGAAHGGLALARAERECAARLPAGRVTLTVQLEEPARPGGILAARSLAGCRGRVLLRWADGPPGAAGAALSITGTWVLRARPLGRRDGVLVVRQVLASDLGPPATRAMRLRGWIVSTTERLFGARAPMVDALVLGRRGGLDPELREAFARAGLVHILAISGFHVGLLTGWMILLLRLLRVRRDAAFLGGGLGSLVYVAFLGWPAPATRAAILGLLLACCFVRQRRVRPGPLLSVTLLAVLLIEPWAVTEVGAWLSGAAIWGLTRATRWSEAALGRRAPVQTLFASLGATLATAPITAWAFGSVAVVGVVLNFVAIPAAAAAVPGILLTLAASLVAPSLSETFAGGTGVALAVLERMAVIGAGVPGGAMHGEPQGPWVVAWVALLGLGLWVISDRASSHLALRRAAWLLVIALWLGHMASRVRGLGAGSAGLTLFVLDVGQGDAAAIRTPAGRWVLVDTGPLSRRFDAGRRVVAPFLARQGARRVDAVVLSHAHLDHIGGAGAVLERLGVGAVVEPALPVADSVYLALLDRVDAAGVPWHPARAGDGFDLDGVRFRIVHPDTTWSGWQEDLNEDSLILLVEFGGFRALFTGDAGFPAETALRGRVGPVDLLKAGHHGSRTASGTEWLTELRPRAVVVSLGLNRYGHPAPATLERIAQSGATLWRTDRDGTVRVRTDGRQVEVRGKGRSQRYEIGQPTTP